MLQPQPRRQQAGLPRRTEIIDVTDTCPELLGRDLQILDCLEQIGYNPMHDLLHPCFTYCVCKSTD